MNQVACQSRQFIYGPVDLKKFKLVHNEFT
jgi:hypothetical protein